MRNNTAYVSRFQRTRIHGTRVMQGDVFPLAVDCNAALAAGATISSVVFSTGNSGAVSLGTVTKNARTASVSCTAGIGCATVKAVITASDGAVFVQLFHVAVQYAPVGAATASA